MTAPTEAGAPYPLYPDSPNGLWQRLGYTIERDGHHRTIRRPDGSVVDTSLIDGEKWGHEAEERAARAELAGAQP